ncbi:MAG: hypothetical protein Hens2KO_09760 [Henriciella sp.]
MRISMIMFLLAALLSVVGAAAHELLGAPKVLAPLATTNLPSDVIWLHHFSWHVGTVAVLTMAALFIAAARSEHHRILAVFATIMSAGFAALAIGLALFGDAVVWSTPAPYPWTIITVLGAFGLIMQPKKSA